MQKTPRYIARQQIPHNVWEVVDTTTGYIVDGSGDAPSAATLADTWNLTGNPYRGRLTVRTEVGS